MESKIKSKKPIIIISGIAVKINHDNNVEAERVIAVAAKAESDRIVAEEKAAAKAMAEKAESDRIVAAKAESVQKEQAQAAAEEKAAAASQPHQQVAIQSQHPAKTPVAMLMMV